MTLLSEKIVVTAREFIEVRNIHDCKDFREPVFQSKLQQFDWDLQFAASAITCEIILKTSWGAENLAEWQQIDRLFSPSAVATYSNLRGSKRFKTGNMPEAGAVAFWRRGNSWQGSMNLVLKVSDDKDRFDVAEGRIMEGSEDQRIKVIELKEKRMGLPFRNDKLNLLGFFYPPNREIK